MTKLYQRGVGPLSVSNAVLLHISQQLRLMMILMWELRSEFLQKQNFFYNKTVMSD